MATQELKHGRQVLESAKRKASNAAINGTLEQRDAAEQGVVDLQAKLQTLEDRVKQIDTEIQGETKAAEVPDLKLSGTAEEDIILPGENLEIYVVEDSTFNGRYQVRRGGYIIMPQLGRVYLAGRKIDQAEAALKKVLETSQLRTATVMIEVLEGSDVESGPLIYLAGEFKRPRPYKIPAGTAPTLVSVYLSSGGASDRADLTCVKVMRIAGGKGVVQEVNLQQILSGVGLASDIRLNDGDVVTIPTTSANVIYVTGNVKRQGSFRLRQGETLNAYACILQSGGFARFADLKKTHILRELPDGTKTKIPLNVIAIQRGQQPDVPLCGNDIIVVPEKFFSF
jgi:protein involved in polysaccharide export with SLBB domain